MRIVFAPEGGFGKTGGFVEVKDGEKITGEDQVYQRQGHLTLRLMCRNPNLRIGAEVRRERAEDDVDPAKRGSFRSIAATGVIQESRWGTHKLSFLGSDSEHEEMQVTIREYEDREGVYAAGIPGDADIDIVLNECFFVEIVLTPERMSSLVKELQMPGAELHVEVKLWKFPRFYAPWSPSIDEGRLIKFLNSRRDVENADQIPEEFWNQDIHDEILEDPDEPPVTVAVMRRLGAPYDSPDGEIAGQIGEVKMTAAPNRSMKSEPKPNQSVIAARKVSRSIWALAISLLIAAFIVAV